MFVLFELLLLLSIVGVGRPKGEGVTPVRSFAFARALEGVNVDSVEGSIIFPSCVKQLVSLVLRSNFTSLML